MAIFRIVATDNSGNESNYLFNSSSLEFLNETKGEFVPIPRLLDGEEKANRGFTPAPISEVVVNHYNYRKNIVANMTRTGCAYLGPDWGNVRLFMEELRDRQHKQQVVIGNKCDACPFKGLCHNKEVAGNCDVAYSNCAAQFSALMLRLTQTMALSIERLDGEQTYDRKWLRNPYYTRVEDIVYSPIYIGAEAPVVNEEKLYAWLRKARTAQAEALSQIDRSKTIYDIGYDTTSDVAFVNAITSPIDGSWFDGFDKEFPELCAFFNRYPLKNKQIMTITTTKDIEEYAKKSNFRFHKDWDKYKIGFRFYAVVDPKPKLLFREVRPEYQAFYTKRLSDGKRFSVPYWHTKDSYSANLLNGPHAWILNTLTVSHAAVDVHENRSVFLLYGDLDFEAFDKVLFESLGRYRDHVMWMADLRKPEKAIDTEIYGI